MLRAPDKKRPNEAARVAWQEARAREEAPRAKVAAPVVPAEAKRTVAQQDKRFHQSAQKN